MNGMTGCSGWREYLSADFDGEIDAFGDSADARALAAAHRHLTACADCTRWFADAARVNRLARTALARPGPGLADAQVSALLDELPRRRHRWWPGLAQLGLALIGLAQTALGALPLLQLGTTGDPHASMMGAGMIHMSHEYTVWNLALGVGFLVGSGWTRHLAGALPVLASFAVVLCVQTAIDVVQGRVEPGRVLSHLLLLAGIVLIMTILASGPSQLSPLPGRWARALPGRPVPRTSGQGETRSDPDDPEAGHAGPRPAARRDAA
jgi:predicted anti-sigma-YlaC factor YlaD